jgi:hypothetical protein
MDVNCISIYGLGAWLNNERVYTKAIIVYVWFGVIMSGSSNSTLMDEHKDLLPCVLRESLAHLPAAMHRLREKNQQLWPPILSDLFTQAEDALFQRADSAANIQQQNTYFESMRQLRLARREICQGFTTGQDQAFAQLLQTSANSASEVPVLGAVDLAPGQNREELVAVDAMITCLAERYAEAIEQLGQGLANQLSVRVHAGNNPYSPRVFCHSFTQPIKALNIDVNAKLLIFTLCDRLLTTQLGEVYRQLNELLSAPNILPSLVSSSTPASDSAAVTAPAKDVIASVPEDVGHPVGMLFDLILSERHLAARMKLLLVRLQLPLLRVVRHDKSFFSSATHPGRRLINAISTAALTWQDPNTHRLEAHEAARCCRLYERISAIAEQLHKNTKAHQRLLPALLLDFIAFTVKERQCDQVLAQSTHLSVAAPLSTLTPPNQVVADAAVASVMVVNSDAVDPAKGVLVEFGDNIEPIWWRQAGSLSQGSWFEMSATEPPLRCRLAAILTSIDKYIFVNRLGVKVVEKNQLQLARALKSNELRVIDDGMSFERALEGVINDLRQVRSLA